MRDDTSIPLLRRYLRFCLPLLYAVTLCLLAPVHRVFNEWSGVMEFFSGKELVAGSGYHGWASEFYPPLFSLLIGVGSLFSSGFLAGKVISILSGAALLVIAYEIAGELSGSANISVGTQAFLALSPLYLHQSLQADNHMFDALLFNSGLLLYMRSAKQPRVKQLFLAGMVCGLAGLTRYTSYVLVLLPLSLGVSRNVRKTLIFTATFIGGFALVSAPWWYYNAKYNGTPLHNLNYLNVCYGLFGADTHSLQALWRWVGDPSVNGLRDIVLSHPGSYIRNIIRNVPLCADLLLSSVGALALFLAPGILESLYILKPNQSAALFGVLAASVFAVSQAVTHRYYLLQWIVVMVALSLAYLLGYLRRLEEKFLGLRRYHAGRWAMSLLVACGLILCGRTLKAYQNETASYSPSVEAAEIAVAIKKHDPEIASKVIMALDPARAYYVGAKYLATPFEYPGTVEGLVCYRDVSARLRHYAPKYPSTMDESSLRADYLVYTRPPEDRLLELHDPPQFAFLMDPKSERIPKSFKPIYQSTNAVVYEVTWSPPLTSGK